MNLVSFYPSLAGSNGTFRLQIDQRFLDSLCDLLRPHLPNSVSDLKITTSGIDRFRLNAKLSSQVVQLLGRPFLNVLGGKGVEVEIKQNSAISGAKLEGRIETTLVGKQVADYIVKALNEAFGDEIIQSTTGWFSNEVTLFLDPFPLLRRYFPGGIGNGITLVQLQTTELAFFIDLIWQHNDVIYPIQADLKGPHMDVALQEFINNLLKNQFADLKGSYADLNLQLSEKLLNDLLAMALTSEQEKNPLLSLVKTAKVNGSLIAEISVKV